LGVIGVGEEGGGGASSMWIAEFKNPLEERKTRTKEGHWKKVRRDEHSRGIRGIAGNNRCVLSGSAGLKNGRAATVKPLAQKRRSYLDCERGRDRRIDSGTEVLDVTSSSLSVDLNLSWGEKNLGCRLPEAERKVRPLRREATLESSIC